MAHTVINMECPGCGAPVTTADKDCAFCKGPITISTFNSVASMPMPDLNRYASAYRKALSEHPQDGGLNSSIAMCYLKLKLYDKALSAFETAIENNFDDPEVYFYAAICLLGSKKAFLATRPTIDRAVEYLNAATTIAPRGIYCHLLAYIKYDYFSRKFFTTSPTYQEVLQKAKELGISDYDISQLYLILGVNKPTQF